MLKRLLRFTAVFIGIYIAVLSVGCGFQRNMIFFPTKLDRAFKLNENDSCHEVFFNAVDGANINALFLKTKSDKVVLYLHGNAQALDNWQKIIPYYQDVSPHGLLLIDYRGYGKSTGKITEKGLYADAEAAYNYLLLQGYKAENIFVYGRSIGTGVAANLAAHHTIRGLILETPYYSFSLLAHEKAPYFLPRLILQYRFPSNKNINYVHAPIIILHGTEDETVPYHHGKKLFEHYNGKDKTLITIPGGHHNDLSKYPEFKKALTEFMKK